MPQKERKLNRWKIFDYTNDRYYFVTICVKNREIVFGDVVDKQMLLNEYGKIVKDCWFDLPNHYLNCCLNEFIIMPNHIHGIIEINNFLNSVVGTGLKPVPTNADKHYSLSEIVRGLKTFSSRKINELNKINFHWQRSFYDRVIRNEKELINIQNYISSNPLNWKKDRNNLENLLM